MLVVDDVVVRGLPTVDSCSGPCWSTDDCISDSCPAEPEEWLFLVPNEKVRPAALRNPLLADFGIGGRGISWYDFLGTGLLESSWMAALFSWVEDGAVEALLCREELSVNEDFVVLFERPLPLLELSVSIKNTNGDAYDARLNFSQHRAHGVAAPERRWG